MLEVAIQKYGISIKVVGTAADVAAQKQRGLTSVEPLVLELLQCKQLIVVCCRIIIGTKMK